MPDDRQSHAGRARRELQRAARNHTIDFVAAAHAAGNAANRLLKTAFLPRS